jgi:Lrp/AsnC family leucine-responsive transcriptional regulator
MDTLDLRILASLDSDARRPFADLARELDVSQPTIADRMRRLEVRGVVRGTMLCVDYARLGFPVNAFVRLRSTPSHKRGLLEVARDIPQIIEMHSVTGDDCMIARIVARSVDELGGILERLSAFAQSSTSVVLGTPIPLRNPIPPHKSLEKTAPAATVLPESRRRDAAPTQRVSSRK